MAWWSLAAAEAADSVDEIVLVCGEHSRSAAQAMVDDSTGRKPLRLTLGGNRRQDSALAGINATSKQVDIVAIHDAARPLVTSDLFDAVIAAARQYGAAIAAVPVSDTIKRALDHRVTATIPRDDLVSVQTPQAFRKQLLLDAFAMAEKTGMSVTDEATLIEQTGGSVRIVPGTTTNLKVTYPSDLALIEALLLAARR
jgi:2-C-methyl-D-erythritol 4-phosphate cytidylyltransferase